MTATSTPARSAGAAQRDGRFLLLWPATFLSAVGSGLVYPVTAIHIASDLRLGVASVALFYGVLAVAATAGAPLGGSLTARLGPRVTALLGGSGQMAAWVVVASARSEPQLAGAAVLSGLGGALFFPALFSTILAGTPEALRKRTFGLRYTVVNLGVAAGAALSGVLLAHTARSSLFLANAASYLPLMLWVRWHAGRERMRAAGAPEEEGRTGREPLWSPAFTVALLVNFLMSTFGAVQLESTVPLILKRLAGQSLSMISVVTVVNSIAVVALQRVLRARIDRLGHAAAVAAAAALWVTAYLLGAASGGAVGHRAVLADGLLVAFAVVFAAGEVAAASSLTPMIVALVPERQIARATGFAGSAWSLGTLVGPSVGAAAVASAGPSGSWVVLTAGGACTLGLTRLLLRPRTTPRRAAGSAAGSD
ncbi:MFS transporter [Kitasatospora sp. NBC_01287]|uniref:MFS transporter n=1 Tax=Kitasatospora sp. NBC_01287 TaxID=2903573 RepID=UPI0022598005|nr:MFS transporter [Kitasatospora sp. NBC_01287]MCX4745122.1 MFS transporter [Kitasatospora sp. NBC_01287]